MASEDAGELTGVAVSEDVRSWLERTADDADVEVERFVRELLAAHHSFDAEGDEPRPLGDVASEDDVEELREEFQDLLEDVRFRVVQVKRETDEKAPRNHDHEAIDSELEDLRSALDGLGTDLESHRSELAALEGDVDEGFENFEEVLEYLIETTDDLSERTDRFARATIATRERLQELAGSIEARNAADRLKRDAALEGIDSADCGDCGQSVRPALLTRSECPFCAATLVDVEPKRGILGSATWETGDRPALAGAEEDPVSEELRSDVERERPDPADVDWDTAGDRDV